MLPLSTFDALHLPGVELQLIMQLLLKLLLASLRVGAFLLSAPLFGARWMPIQVRMILAITMGALAVSQTPVLEFGVISNADAMIIVLTEIAIGLTAGLVLTIWFAAMLMAGEKIAQSSGLGFAMQVDPMTGASTPAVSQTLYIFLLVVFVSLDGHLVAIRMMIESYAAMSIGTLVSPETLVLAGISAAGSMFLSAAIIMTPIAMTLLMVNVTVGVISRSAPSLNLFSFGFPITLMAVFILLYMSVGGIAISAESLIESGLTYSQNLIDELSNG